VASILVDIELAASPAVVWADIRRIETHAEWMLDAVAIRFTGDTTIGAGTTFDCDTKVGSIRLTDRMEITEWVEDEVMGVRHVGVVTGDGRFTLVPAGPGRTRFTWQETLTFPWWLGGPIGGVVGGRLLTLVWRRNLRALAGRFAD
jgi:hypothetical protein